MPDRQTLAGVNRRLYSDTDSMFWQRTVYEPVHKGRAFINMGGEVLLDRVISAAEIGERSSVLDLCCGSADPACYLVEKTGCTVSGVEMNLRQVQRARELVAKKKLQKKVKIFAGDALDWRNNKSEFDCIVCLDSLMLIAKWQVFLNVVRNGLHASGRFFASTIVSHNIDSSVRRMLWDEDAMVSLPGESEAENMFFSAGLLSVSSVDLTSHALKCMELMEKAIENLESKEIQLIGSRQCEDWLRMNTVYRDLFATGQLRYLLFQCHAAA